MGNSKSSVLWGDLPGSSVQAALWGNLAVTVNRACSGGIYREATLERLYDAIYWEQKIQLAMGEFTGKQCSRSSMG